MKIMLAAVLCVVLGLLGPCHAASKEFKAARKELEKLPGLKVLFEKLDNNPVWRRMALQIINDPKAMKEINGYLLSNAGKDPIVVRTLVEMLSLIVDPTPSPAVTGLMLKVLRNETFEDILKDLISDKLLDLDLRILREIDDVKQLFKGIKAGNYSMEDLPAIIEHLAENAQLNFILESLEHSRPLARLMTFLATNADVDAITAELDPNMPRKLKEAYKYPEVQQLLKGLSGNPEVQPFILKVLVLLFR